MIQRNKHDIFIHPTAQVEKNVIIGHRVKIWHFCHVRENSVIGDDVSLGKDVYIDKGVVIGRQTRIQNGVSVYTGVNVSEWCFIGPHVIFTNDVYPRAGLRNWEVIETNLEIGMSIGAGAIVRCGVNIGAFAMVGAGAVVTRSIAPFHLHIGIPARYEKMICACGMTRIDKLEFPEALVLDCCMDRLPEELYLKAKEYIMRNKDYIIRRKKKGK